MRRDGMRLFVVVVLATSLIGCSFVTALRKPLDQPAPSCAPAEHAFVFDLVGAGVLFAALGAVTSSPPDPAGSGDQPSYSEVIGLGLGALMLTLSGLNGMEAAGQCHADERARQERQVRDDSATEQRVAASEHAWKLTEQAETAARAGDCATVVRLQPVIGAIDREMLGVFERDVAVVACLHPGARAMTAP